MISRMKRWMALGLALGLVGTVRAQEPAKEDPCGRLEDADLPKLLENMGYAPEKVDDGVYRVVIDQDNWTIYLRFSLSTDGGQKVWITTSFGEIPNWEKAPAEPLMKLLILNDSIGPAHFYVTQSGTSRKLNLAKAVDNRGITASVLRREIDKFVGSVKSTADNWDTASWTKTPGVPGDVPAGTPAAGTSTGEGTTSPGSEAAATPSAEAPASTGEAAATPAPSKESGSAPSAVESPSTPPETPAAESSQTPEKP